MALGETAELLHLALVETNRDSLFTDSHIYQTIMKNSEPVGNNVLAEVAKRCDAMSVNSIGIELEDEEIAILERVRALGYSSNAGVIRLATLAWKDHAARLPAEEQAAPAPDGLNSPDHSPDVL